MTHANATTAAAPGPTRVAVSPITGIAPMAGGFDVNRETTLPKALRGALFADDNRQTYAVLDAARVTNLPEMLETSGLPHRCLFKGQAEEDLGSVAPWLVQLEPDHVFTRAMFTQSDAPWHLWGMDPGVLLRADMDIDEMRGHLRRFTRVRDEADRWYYWRFWEGRHLAASLQAADETDRQAFFDGGRITVCWLRVKPEPAVEVMTLAAL